MSSTHKTHRDVNRGDRVFFRFVQTAALSLVILLTLIAVFLTKEAWPAIEKFGANFFVSNIWDPVVEDFGALPVIYGTIVSSVLAVVLAGPISVGVAVFLTELASRRIGRVVAFFVEMLAAIPSVVYGLWGIFVLAPFLRDHIQSFLGEWLGFLPFFSGPAYGVGMMSAAIILTIMITPTISSICREVFLAVPRVQREAALALGATKWETIRLAVLRSSWIGIFAAVMLGLGRALGETMAVTMLIGNRSEIDLSLFAPGQTMASVIANEYAEASSDMHHAALVYVGLTLFLLTLFINAGARLIVWRVRSKYRR